MPLAGTWLLASVSTLRILSFYTAPPARIMNAPLLPEILRREATPQVDLPLATEGVQRYVWGSKFGEMLIEVVDGVVMVNGERVEPAPAEATRERIGPTLAK